MEANIIKSTGINAMTGNEARKRPKKRMKWTIFGDASWFR
jgi:hypothetical protein